jgi:hypothetical protein
VANRRQRLGALPLVCAALAAAGCGGADRDDDNATAKAHERNAIAAELARVQIRPGLWEATSEVLSVAQPGLPHEMAEQMKGRRSVGSVCITPERAARPDGGFLDAAGRGCTHSGFAMRGGRAEGTTVCRDPAGGAETRARLNGRYGPEYFDFELEMTTPGFGGQSMTVLARRSGRRVGECTRKGEAEQ